MSLPSLVIFDGKSSVRPHSLTENVIEIVIGDEKRWDVFFDREFGEELPKHSIAYYVSNKFTSIYKLALSVHRQDWTTARFIIGAENPISQEAAILLNPCGGKLSPGYEDEGKILVKQGIEHLFAWDRAGFGGTTATEKIENYHYQVECPWISAMIDFYSIKPTSSDITHQYEMIHSEQFRNLLFSLNRISIMHYIHNNVRPLSSFSLSSIEWVSDAEKMISETEENSKIE